MKSITEFASFTLDKGLKAKAALTAEGKTPEETQTSLGESFKFEGDKLKYFMSALEVAGQNPENLRRVLVISLNEGEQAPPKATKVEEVYFVPEYQGTAKPVSQEKAQGKGGGRGGPGGKGRSGGKGGEKESPWGLSPEQIAAKKGKGGPAKANAAAKSK